MATIVIRKLDETIKRKLQVRAAQNGRSMEAEAREILSDLVINSPRLRSLPDAVEIPKLDRGLGTAIHDLFAPLGGVNVPIPPRRKSHRPIPDFS